MSEITVIDQKNLIEGFDGKYLRMWSCDCGAPVYHYCCNSPLTEMRPEAVGSDWWAACTNKDCPNHYGEDIFQNSPDWQHRIHDVS